MAAWRKCGLAISFHFCRFLSGGSQVILKAEENLSNGKGERIAKIISKHISSLSRRKAEEVVKAGHVMINGEKACVSDVVFSGDRVKIFGKELKDKFNTELYVAHKLGGEIVSRNDPMGRPTLFDRLKKMGLPELRSVGRLDYNSEGLILLTNDGDLVRYLEHPKFEFERTYRVRLHGKMKQSIVDTLAHGLKIGDTKYRPLKVEVKQIKGANTWVDIKTTEGKNREIRKIMEHFRLKISRLIRIQYGPYFLGNLSKGDVLRVSTKPLPSNWRQEIEEDKKDAALGRPRKHRRKFKIVSSDNCN